MHPRKFATGVDEPGTGARAALHVVADHYCSHVTGADNSAAQVVRAPEERAADAHAEEFAAGGDVPGTVARAALHVVANIHRADAAVAVEQATVIGGTADE